jgi:hypothetical protein
VTIPTTQITSTGVVVPDCADVLAGIQDLFGSIYGADTVLNPNTQDEQMLAIFAQAISALNQLAAAVYNAYSPVYAQGAGLSALVLINAIRRLVPTYSTCTVTLTGTANTVINNGQVGDNQNLGTVWDLPSTVTIGTGGTVTVTATCTTPGAINLSAGQLSVILTPTLNWQSVTNGSNTPSVGSPVESDAALRERQVVSTAGPAVTPAASIAAAVANVPGVTNVAYDNNDTGSADGNGVPGHTISVIVVGGAQLAIATAIFNKKSEGTGTYGSTSQVVVDENGVSDTINFYYATTTAIYAIFTVTPLTGYSLATASAIQAAVLAYIEGLDIGEPVVYFTLAGIATLQGTQYASQFSLESVTIGTTPSPVGTSDITIAFNAIAASATANLSVVS